MFAFASEFFFSLSSDALHFFASAHSGGSEREIELDWPEKKARTAAHTDVDGAPAPAYCRKHYDNL